MVNKKAILILLLVIFGAVLVSGCIGESNDQTGNTSADGKNESINETSEPEPLPDFMNQQEDTHEHGEECQH